VYPTNYYIALGTNVGNYINNFSNAILELKKIGQVVKMANIYKSKPYGYLKQNFF
jgi:7,8-dihydro-6-hydroxymethylpterin-pyrophosphokinase